MDAVNKLFTARFNGNVVCEAVGEGGNENMVSKGTLCI